MANPLNRVLVEGNIVADPELRHTNNGTAVTSFRIGHNRWFKSGDDLREDTSFFNIEAWGVQAERVCETACKGGKVAITGRLSEEQWEKDGERRYKTKIVAQHVDFLDHKRVDPMQSDPQSDEAEEANRDE